MRSNETGEERVLSRREMLSVGTIIKRILLNTHFEGFYTYEDKELGEIADVMSFDGQSVIDQKGQTTVEKNTKTSNYEDRHTTKTQIGMWSLWVKVRSEDQ